MAKLTRSLKLWNAIVLPSSEKSNPGILRHLVFLGNLLIWIVDVRVAIELDPIIKFSSHADNHPNAQLCGKHFLDLTLTHLDDSVGATFSKIDRFQIAMRLLLHVSVEVFARVKQMIADAAIKQEVSAELCV